MMFAVADDLDEARAIMPGAVLSPVNSLAGSNRSSVRRALLSRPGEGPTTVIVKTFMQAEGWARESAALAVLPPEAPAPRLLASGASPPVVVMSDLGQGTSVADALLGSDPSAAGEAIYSWVKAIAAVHRTTFGVHDQFRAELHARSAVRPTSVMDIGKALEYLREACVPLGIGVSESLGQVFQSMADSLSNDAASALSPGDTCPDNNVFTNDGLFLIDFEHAEWRHVAWDLAYLRVPWPSCWCSWLLPDSLADKAIARYREVISDQVPYVNTAAFDRDLAAATDLWSVLYSSWFLSSALADDPPTARGLHGPRRRALLLHRLDLAVRTSAVAEVAAFAAELRTALKASQAISTPGRLRTAK